MRVDKFSSKIVSEPIADTQTKHDKKVCDSCFGERILSVYGHVSDSFDMQYKEHDYTGYDVPFNLNIGDLGDLEFDYCLDCGKIQAEFPLNEDVVMSKFNGGEDEDDYFFKLIEQDI